jgi:hypothetical protein
VIPATRAAKRERRPKGPPSTSRFPRVSQLPGLDSNQETSG